MGNRNGTFTQLLDEKLISSLDLSEVMSSILALGNQVRIRAKGWSMSPFIRDMDIITIAPLCKDSVKLGDIVAFTGEAGENSFRLGIHRVVQKLEDGSYLIKGDNTANDPDGIVPQNRILGRVIKIERNNRIVRFGLGRERFMIAQLSKRDMLFPIITSMRKLKQIIRKGKSP
jgi:phage repressor protein C with HTH and peptisase S24 domain